VPLRVEENKTAAGTIRCGLLQEPLIAEEYEVGNKDRHV